MQLNDPFHANAERALFQCGMQIVNNILKSSLMNNLAQMPTTKQPSWWNALTRKENWDGRKSVSFIDFVHSSRKGWKTFYCLTGRTTKLRKMSCQCQCHSSPATWEWMLSRTWYGVRGSGELGDQSAEGSPWDWWTFNTVYSVGIAYWIEKDEDQKGAGTWEHPAWVHQVLQARNVVLVMLVLLGLHNDTANSKEVAKIYSDCNPKTKKAC